VSELVATAFADGVLRVTLSRPEKRNALSNALIAAVGKTFAEWSTREDLSLAVLTGSGDKAFASGGDLKELETLRGEAEARTFAARTRAAFDQIRRFPVPVLAILNGDALGGGAELAMACDHRLGLAHARIGFLQAKLNIATAWGGGTDLFTQVGPSRAVRILASAQIFPAAEAQRLGLVDAVAPAGDQADRFVQSYIGEMTQRPQVMRAIKSLAVMHRFGGSAEERASREGACFAAAWVHDDHWVAVANMAFGRRE
jgi:enoyl-CoA hydratase